MPYIISDEEYQLLEAAKEFTRVTGQKNGYPVTWKGQEERGRDVLVRLVDAGAAPSDASPSGYTRDLPPPTTIGQ